MSSQQKEDQHASRVTRKKIHMRQMLGESRIAVFSQWFVLPDVPKVASLKRPVRRQLFSRQMNTIHEHAAVARSRFWRQNVQNTAGWDQFWTFWCSKMARRCGTFSCQKMARKMARPCGAKHICKSKCTKNLSAGTDFGSSDVQKSHAAVARSTFVSQNAQNTHVWTTFWRSDVQKSHAAVARSNICKSKCTKHLLFAAFWEVSNWLPH